MGKVFFPQLLWIVSFICLVYHLPGRGADVLTANFDTLQEGIPLQVLSDGGLTFSTLDNRVGDFNPPGRFTADWADGYLLPPFSSPNVLAPGGYSSGGRIGFPRFGSAWIDFDGTALAASLDVFTPPPDGTHSQNILSLEAWQGPVLVTSSSVSFTDGLRYHRLNLVSPAPFDRLRLNASGPVDHGVLFAVFDNVSVTLRPQCDGFCITSLKVQPNSVTITWRSQPGETYYIEFKAALTDPHWTPISGGIIAQGTQASWTGLRGTASAFYRVAKLD